MPAQISANKYLPHIDGLRGVAVLAVVFYHLDISLFKGGFVGVDVFFVISGYLITSLICNSIAQESFSLLSFYLRRARRLLPAFFFTLCLTLFAGALILSTVSFERLGESTLYSILSLSNFFFWQEAGYFDTNASLKPLLHLWSLSVEEQFYLIWPSLLLLLKPSKITPYILLGLALISLFLAEYYLRKDPALVFYMTPFRIVEFCVGGILYWVERFKITNKQLLEAMAALGLIMIGASVIFYSKEFYFPGISALLPCFGTALIIYSGAKTITGKALKHRSLVFIGLTSYSLYLIHWPIIVFYQYQFGEFLAFPDQALILGFSLASATLMFYFVEKPFRKSDEKYLFSIKKFAFLTFSTATLLIAASLHVYLTNGWSWRYPEVQLIRDQISNAEIKRYAIHEKLCGQAKQSICNIASEYKANNVLVLGDSHAIDALNIFSQAFPSYHYTVSELGGCPPMVPTDFSLLSIGYPAREECISLNQGRLSSEFLKNYEYILINVLFSWYHIEHFERAINQIQTSSDAEIIVMGNYIELNMDMAELAILGIDPRLNPETVNSFALFENELRTLAENRYTFISKKDFFCQSDDIANCTINFNGVPFSYDRHHLNIEASTAFSKYLIELSNGNINNLVGAK